MVRDSAPEYYSIGVNQRLNPDQITTIRAHLEDPTMVTEDIAASIYDKPIDVNDDGVSIIDKYIQRSRLSTFERN